MLEFLFQIVAELFVQLAFELLVQLGFHSIAEPFRKTQNPVLAALGYTFFGTLAGGLSLLIFHAHFIATRPAQILNLIVTPLAVGLVMSLVGAWRARHGQSVLRIDRFAYGYLFAMAFALIRFWFAGPPDGIRF